MLNLVWIDKNKKRKKIIILFFVLKLLRRRIKINEFEIILFLYFAKSDLKIRLQLITAKKA